MCTEKTSRLLAKANFDALLNALPEAGIIAGLDETGANIVMVSWSVTRPPYLAKYSQEAVTSSDVTYFVAGSDDVIDIVEGFLVDQGLFATMSHYTRCDADDKAVTRLAAVSHWQHGGIPHIQMCTVTKLFETGRDFEFYEPIVMPGIGRCITSGGHTPCPVLLEGGVVDIASSLWNADRHASVLAKFFPYEGRGTQSSLWQAVSS